MSDEQKRIGVDIGGTNLRVALVAGRQVTDEFRCHADFSAICRTHAPDVAWRQIVDVTAGALRQMLQRYPDTVSIGIGFPGFIDPTHGIVRQSPNLPGLHDVDLAGELSHSLKRPVAIENDANAAAYGEYRLHPQTVSSLIYLGLGTGVGGGLIIRDKLITGSHGFAMEIGHLIVEAEGRLCGCGNRGCMEQYASASGVSLSYAEKTGKQLDAGAISALAETGDAAALDAFERAGDALAQGLAHILKVVDVPNVVIGGGMSRAWRLLQPAFSVRLQRDLIPALRDHVAVRIADSADLSGVIGAALLSARGCKSN